MIDVIAESLDISAGLDEMADTLRRLLFTSTLTNQARESVEAAIAHLDASRSNLNLVNIHVSAAVRHGAPAVVMEPEDAYRLPRQTEEHLQLPPPHQEEDDSEGEGSGHSVSADPQAKEPYDNKIGDCEKYKGKRSVCSGKVQIYGECPEGCNWHFFRCEHHKPKRLGGSISIHVRMTHRGELPHFAKLKQQRLQQIKEKASPKQELTTDVSYVVDSASNKSLPKIMDPLFRCKKPGCDSMQYERDLVQHLRQEHSTTVTHRQARLWFDEVKEQKASKENAA